MSDQSDPSKILARSARLVARGGSLEARLDGLAEQARLAAGAMHAVIYLFDGEQGLLVPGGTAGLSSSPPPQDGVETVAVDAEGSDVLGETVRERRSQIVEITDATRRGLPAAIGKVRAAAQVPIVTEDAQGAQEVEGLLSVGYAAMPAKPGDALARLEPIADIAAAAIRLTRLEQALLERSDWFDRIANTDPLTGIANRRTFERMLELELARAGRQATPVSLAIFDVDGLAAIGRERGAHIADDVLRRVAAALADSVRLVDTVARYGGDEFVLLAPGTAGVMVAQRVLGTATAAVAEGEPKVTLSVGVARFPDDGATSAELLAAADVALHAAKARGRGQIVESGAIAGG